MLWVLRCHLDSGSCQDTRLCVRIAHGGDAWQVGTPKPRGGGRLNPGILGCKAKMPTARLGWPQPLQGPLSSAAARKMDVLPASLARSLAFRGNSNLPGVSRLGRQRPTQGQAGIPRRLRADEAPLWVYDAISTLGGVFRLHRKNDSETQ